MIVNIKKIDINAIVPAYSISGDAGLDLTATSLKIDKHGNRVYGTGLAIEIPSGHVGYIFPRSSVSKKTLVLANSVGVIDSNYRGEIICKFKPTPQFTAISSETFTQEEMITDDKYEIGERVAQLIIMPIPHITFNEVDELSETDRGEGGFGSTNKE
tara:strand:+ start:7578 stop:8048 length:471 start_codon:yes stop_codon:yes gene_type:complete